MAKSDGVIMTKSFEFAVTIMAFYKVLMERKCEYILCKQLLRCGTSIGANIREAHNAESKNDFIHKMAVAQKETSELLYWLELLTAAELTQPLQTEPLCKEATEILKIIRSIILTTKNGPTTRSL
jgi:four helix bundle protein